MSGLPNPDGRELRDSKGSGQVLESSDQREEPVKISDFGVSRILAHTIDPCSFSAKSDELWHPINSGDGNILMRSTNDVKDVRQLENESSGVSPKFESRIELLPFRGVMLFTEPGGKVFDGPRQLVSWVVVVVV
ncbi:hypothetical protein ACFX15_012886 [Malus domestica]